MGQAPTEDELFQMISEVDDNMSGSIDFGEFLKVVESQKNRAETLDDENDMVDWKWDDENDMVDAFVACGGQADKSGHVKRKYYYWISLMLFLFWSCDTHKHLTILLCTHSFLGETMIKIIKHDFGLTIDIEELINKIDTDGSGEIEFDEFSLMLGK